MGKHIVIGAGQVGGQLARLLAGQGHEVTVVTRSGSGPVAAGITRVSADVSDREGLTGVAKGADVIYNCVNPQYHRWAEDWPPMAAAILGTAETTGAGLVTLGNLYIYGEVDRPMTEDTPLAAAGTKGRVRAKMWLDMEAAHREGRVRVTELRGSDFYGPGMSDQSFFGDRFIAPILAGKTVRHIGAVDQPHSVTYLPDVARALAVAGSGERAWGRPWHIPTASPAPSVRQMAVRFAEIAGAPAPKVTSIPAVMLRAAGLFSPMIRELRETQHQRDKPFILDSTPFETTFGVAPTSVDTALRESLDWWRAGRPS
ncbi:NAD-dependent epimerase/dehydratase family protein [Sphaerisporangium aureirubrum]|uniref:NAD-dependent epimerase/dehydratase family protein n=1 Tax=Sphaerisporangium aureirubrum TaxID=1544736 RepID=A0ABW1NKD8_9ACTN